MSIQKIVLSATLAIATSFGSLVATASEESQQASLVVYRAGESVRTERVKLNVYLGSEEIGRLGKAQPLATAHEAGTYTVSTSVSGAEDLTIDLKPGKVHYVRLDVKPRGSSVKIEFVEVEEQVARVEYPSLSSAI